VNVRIVHEGIKSKYLWHLKFQFGAKKACTK